MKLLVAIVALLLGVPQSADQPYELKGDVPGMTLNQFKANHKHAMFCQRPSSTVTKCHVYQGVSFAGVEGNSSKSCGVPGCVFQGIFADFVDDRLVRLRYGVSMGSAAKIIVALKQKYGEPSKVAEKSGAISGATWRNSVGYLSVSDSWAPPSLPLDSYTDITSGLNDAGEGKDI